MCVCAHALECAHLTFHLVWHRSLFCCLSQSISGYVAWIFLRILLSLPSIGAVWALRFQTYATVPGFLEGAGIWTQAFLLTHYPLHFTRWVISLAPKEMLNRVEVQVLRERYLWSCVGFFKRITLHGFYNCMIYDFGGIWSYYLQRVLKETNEVTGWLLNGPWQDYTW